jgi:4-amino-4-deoxy-L-arabinose transferase-like glycosyltransferase
MANATAFGSSNRALAAAVDYARRAPERVLWTVLTAHVVVWTALPILVCPNLQLDLVEDLALGKEWQLGYWKHPPLPWWMADLLYRLVGRVEVVYVLGPLATAACIYLVWRLARELVAPLEALAAALVLEAVHFYNFSAVKFAHDQAQLPFWAATGLFLYRALARGRSIDWLLAGVALALCFWSKYAAFVLAGSIGLLLLFDPLARRAWWTPGPYLMACAFALVIAPNAWWLLEHGFQPLHYVDLRAKIATHWYEFVLFPLHWIGSQLQYLAIAMALIGGLLGPRLRMRAVPDADAAFARRYVTLLALGPFLMTTLIAIVLGRMPVPTWGYPLWSFAPLAAILWFAPVEGRRRSDWFVAGLGFMLIAMPAAYAATELLEPFVRDRATATQFPGRHVAETVARGFRERTGAPLVYVGGDDFIANNVAVYASEHPHVIVAGDPALSPWIDMADVRRRGAVFVCNDFQTRIAPPVWSSTFAGAEPIQTLVLPRQTLKPVAPLVIHYAIVLPRP